MALQCKRTYWIFQFFPLTRTLVVIALYYLLNNIIISFLLLALLQFLYYKIIYYLKGYIPLLNIDKIFINYKEYEDYMGICFIKVTKNKQKDLLNYFFENAFKSLPKLRSHLKFFLGEYWWEPISYEKAINKFKVTYDSKTIMNTTEDMCMYSNKELKIHIDIHSKDNLFPFEAIVFNNSSSNNDIIAFKFHHILGDGMAFISLFIAMGKNYDPSIFPITIKKPTIIMKMLLYLKIIIFLPYYCLNSIIDNMFRVNCGPSSFKYHNHNKLIYSKPDDSDNSKTVEIKDIKIEDLKNIKNGISDINSVRKPKDGTIFTSSKQYNLQDYIKINKFMGITFNDLIVSIILSAVNKFYKSKNYNKDNISIICPINMRGLPTSVNDVLISNNTIGFSIKLPLINNSLTDSYNIRKKLSESFRDIAYLKSLELMFKAVIFFLPEELSKRLFNKTIRDCDMVISNVPGPKKSVFYNDIELVEYIPFLTTGMQSNFFTIASYNNKFRFCFNVNEGVELNPWEVTKFIENEFDFVLENFIKNNL